METLCDLLADGGDHLISGGGPGASLLEVACSYGRGFAEQGYPPRSLVLVAVRQDWDRLAVAFGAWWGGHRVRFACDDDRRRRDDMAVAVGAVLQVCDPDDIVDEEHLRHRDVPAIPPAELALPAAAWPARCRPEHVAVEASGPGGHHRAYPHTELAGWARVHARSRPPEADPAWDADVGLVRAAALALAGGPPLALQPRPAVGARP
jgi:hypothetical protein